MGDCLDQPVPTRSFRVLVYPASMPVSNRALQVLADALRRHRTAMGSRWRRLPPGRQALLVLAHLRKGETYTALAGGFGVGTTTVFRYVREGIDVLRPSAGHRPPQGVRHPRRHPAVDRSCWHGLRLRPRL